MISIAEGCQTDLQAGIVLGKERRRKLICQWRIHDDRGITITVYGRGEIRGNRHISTTPWALCYGPHNVIESALPIDEREVERRRRRGWRA